jgi:hypothetical protein
MSKRKDDEPSTRTEPAIAKIIVADTLRASYSEEGLHGADTVKDVLKALESDDGDTLIQSEISRLLADNLAEMASGTPAQLDTRVALNSVSINALLLKQETIKQLGEFLGLEPVDRTKFLETVFPQ